jgi:aminopeptidase N
MYASRWFPFHDYAADRATSDITFIVPSGLQVAGTSDDAIVAQPDAKSGAVRYRFVHRKPVLIGNFAAGQYINRNLRYHNYELQLYAMPGSEKRLEAYAELTGRVLEFYTKQYGAPLFRHLLRPRNDLPVEQDVRHDAPGAGRETPARDRLSVVGTDCWS